MVWEQTQDLPSDVDTILTFAEKAGVDGGLSEKA